MLYFRLATYIMGTPGRKEERKGGRERAKGGREEGGGGWREEGVPYNRGAPKASGILSMLYFRLATYMMGTPGIFLSLLFKSLSQVATMKQRC
jgi:hypothetical protein